MTEAGMEQLERIARAMCVADNHDPDGAIPVDRTVTGNVSGPAEPAPRWQVYVPEARRFIAAHRAL